MLLATWNVNGIRARSQLLAEWLADRKPDVVCLQELKIVEENFPHLELCAAGYHALVAGQQGYNGVAILAREMPSLVMRALPGAPSAGARFLVANVASLEIATVYVPNGKTVTHADYTMKLQWLESLAAFCASRTHEGAPLVVGGDFNVCATDLDSYGGTRFQGQIFHTDQERAHITRMTASGLVDLYRQQYPESPGYSWWDYRAGAFHKNCGMRLDLWLAAAPIAARVKNVYVDRDYRKKSKTGAVPSDHAPVIADLLD